jgi:hypothetical protein
MISNKMSTRGHKVKAFENKPKASGKRKFDEKRLSSMANTLEINVGSSSDVFDAFSAHFEAQQSVFEKSSSSSSLKLGPYRENDASKPFKNPIGSTPKLIKKDGAEGNGCCDCGLFVKYVDRCQHRCGNTGEVVHAWCTTTDQPDFEDALSFDKIWCKKCFYPWSYAMKNKDLLPSTTIQILSEETGVIPDMVNDLNGEDANEDFHIGMNSPAYDPPAEQTFASDKVINRNDDDDDVLIMETPRETIKKKGLLTEVVPCVE